MTEYVHGYSPRETRRLREQSLILEELLHSDTAYPAGSRVLEAGCGVGGQTVILARRSPEAHFTSVDISADSLAEAQRQAEEAGLDNVRFQPADIMDLPFEEGYFDHVFVCFVLEHLSQPDEALLELKRVLRPGGTLTVIEGDHGSCFWHPCTADSLLVWSCLIRAQQELGHDPLIGRRLCPLVNRAGFRVENVSPRWAYTDAGTPQMTEGAVNHIIVPMTRTARDRALEMGLVDPDTWERGICDLEEVARHPDGTFFYTWFKAKAVK